MEDSHKYTIDSRYRTSIYRTEYVTLPLHKSEWFLIGDTARFQMNGGDIPYYEEKETERDILTVSEKISMRAELRCRKCSMRDKAEISKQHRKTIKFLTNTIIR